MAIVAEWVAADWGTSRLRVWAMQGRTVLAQASSDNGMSRLDKAEFEPALMDLIEPWLADAPVNVIACGMVGARQGWVEAPYQTVPANPMARRPVPVPGTNPLLRVHVVPGLKQPKPAEVMRGEETQIAGFLSLNPRWDGVICLPGTHTKWAQISAGEVVSFRTAMTGEMFALLSEKSVLRHSVAEGWDDEAFHDAVDRAMSRPESLMTDLFGLRAQDLLHAQSSAVGRGRLSGLLIGAELAAVKPYWIGQQLAVIGASGLSGIYAKALDRQGVPVTIADGTKMTLAGLAAAERDLET